MAPSCRRAPTVLLVDDDEDIRLLWRLTFKLHGGFGTIWEASDGAAALAMLKVHPPDVVVTDFAMPGVSGFEVLDAVRASYPAAIVVMASGTEDVGDEALRQGASAFFTKYESTTEHMPRLVSALLAEAAALRAPTSASRGERSPAP